MIFWTAHTIRKCDFFFFFSIGSGQINDQSSRKIGLLQPYRLGSALLDSASHGGAAKIKTPASLVGDCLTAITGGITTFGMCLFLIQPKSSLFNC